MISPGRIIFSLTLALYQDYSNILCWDMKSSFGAEEHKIIFYNMLPQIFVSFILFSFKWKIKHIFHLGFIITVGIPISWLINNYDILIHSMGVFSINILPCGFIFPISMCIFKVFILCLVFRGSKHCWRNLILTSMVDQSVRVISRWPIANFP